MFIYILYVHTRYIHGFHKINNSISKLLLEYIQPKIVYQLYLRIEYYYYYFLRGVFRARCTVLLWNSDHRHSESADMHAVNMKT